MLDKPSPAIKSAIQQQSAEDINKFSMKEEKKSVNKILAEEKKEIEIKPIEPQKPKIEEAKTPIPHVSEPLKSEPIKAKSPQIFPTQISPIQLPQQLHQPIIEMPIENKKETQVSEENVKIEDNSWGGEELNLDIEKEIKKIEEPAKSNEINQAISSNFDEQTHESAKIQKPISEPISEPKSEQKVEPIIAKTTESVLEPAPKIEPVIIAPQAEIKKEEPAHISQPAPIVENIVSQPQPQTQKPNIQNETQSAQYDEIAANINNSSPEGKARGDALVQNSAERMDQTGISDQIVNEQPEEKKSDLVIQPNINTLVPEEEYSPEKQSERGGDNARNPDIQHYIEEDKRINSPPENNQTHIATIIVPPKIEFTGPSFSALFTENKQKIEEFKKKIAELEAENRKCILYFL